MATRKLFPWLIFCLQLLFIVIFGIWGKYGRELDAPAPENNKKASDGGTGPRLSHFDREYPMFQDINLMIFAGIGCLYAFLWRYGYTGLTMNFLLCAVAVQWGIIVNKSFHLKDGKMELDVTSLAKGEFAAASAVISLGAIFGKVSFVQMIIFTLMEVLIYSVMNNCVQAFLQISDVGESVALHLFAAIFGCTTAFMVDRGRTIDGNTNKSSSYMSNQMCYLGTLILWVFWPSFNAYGDEGDSQHRSIVNTYFALIGSGMTSFATSAILHEDNLITMSHVQNGALAGAVGIGAISNLMIQPFVALLVGSLSGIVCVVGFKYFTPLLARLKVHDPCGINSLHGWPGLFSGILGILAAFLADAESYGYSLYKFYPARAPLSNTTELLTLQENSPRAIHPGTGRSPEIQALFQFIYIVVILVASAVGGLTTGTLLKVNILDYVEEKEMYLDDIMFDMSDLKQ